MTSIALRCTMLLLALLVSLSLLAPPASAAWPPPEPAEPVLSVTNTTGFARDGELVRGGVPIPRSRNLSGTTGLAVIDDGGNAIPASFTVLARWNAPLADTTAPIQWLLVRFRASVAPQATRSFRLRMDGSVANPAPAQPLLLTRVGNAITIDTRAARFVLGGQAGQVFDRIESTNGGVLSTASAFSSTIDGSLASGFSTVRRVLVEHVDALSAVVIVEGEYAHPPMGGAAISGGRRLEFAAGSSGVNVREWIDWEGQHCAFEARECFPPINAVLLQRWRLELAPTFAAPRSIGLQADPAEPMTMVAATAGSSAALRQRRRADTLQPQRFELDLPGRAQVAGERADSGVALLASAQGALGVALKRMSDYEPQALRLLTNGSLAIDLADDGAWIAARQGLFGEYRVAAFDGGVASGDAFARLWPPLHAPLLALPAAQWVAASQATDEFPVGTLAPSLASYDTLLQDLIARTLQLRRDRGFEGLSTFGLYPRNWGNPVLLDELQCPFDETLGRDLDPTQDQDWDDLFWCALWTDYHNTTATSFVAAWRYADPSSLHDISQPAAMRQLHTQLVRCAPGDEFFFCGQVPSGYGAYRVDRNSSHQYVENLIMNYWMTGDRTILERLRQGARNYRGYICPSRGGEPAGPVCAPSTPTVDTFAGFNDRVANQFYQIFRFVGLAGDDPSFLEDWRSNEARFMTQNFALLNYGGEELGFTEPSGAGTLDYIDGPGTYYSTQLWMASIYDFNMLYRWQVDSGDQALGSPAIAPSRARQGWARMLLAASELVNDGSLQGRWPNTVRYTFAGARIGGTLTLLEPGWAPNPEPPRVPFDECYDSCLYAAGKATLSAVLARTTDDLDDAAMRARALALAEFSLGAITAERVPMGKTPGEFFSRLGSAIARLSLAPVDANRMFGDGFEN
jgi:hypothetical protein